jgi:hypothetical protein
MEIICEVAIINNLYAKVFGQEFDTWPCQGLVFLFSLLEQTRGRLPQRFIHKAGVTH